MTTTIVPRAAVRSVPLAWVAAGALAVAAGVWVLAVFDPNAAGNVFPRCLFHTLTGLYCPGCGITRALHALVHGDLPRALAMNAFLVAALPCLALMAAQAWLQRRLLPAALSRTLSNGYAWIGALLVFGVLRNLPWLPFTWLAPG